MDLAPTPRRPDQVFDDHRIPVALILPKERLLRAVDKLRDALSPVAAAPDQMELLVPPERDARPVRFEALDDFCDIVWMCRNNGVVASFGQVLRVPVEGFHKGRLIIHNHGLLMRRVVVGVAVDDFYTARLKFLAGCLIFRFTVAADWIQHDAYAHAAPLCGNDSLQEFWIGKQEHFDAQGCLRVVDGIDNRFCGIIGHHH